MLKLTPAAVALSLVAALPAFAEDTVTVYEPRDDGNGVTQSPGQLTPEEAALVIGDNDMPENATGVIIEEGEPVRWTTDSPEEVNEKFGGEGTPEIVPFGKDGKEGDETEEIDLFPGKNPPDPDPFPEDPPEELFPEKQPGDPDPFPEDPSEELFPEKPPGEPDDPFPPDPPRDLFPDDPPEDPTPPEPPEDSGPDKRGENPLQPRSGVWGMGDVSSTFEGCPAMIAEAVVEGLGSMNTFPVRQITMPDPFHPSAIWEGLDWSRIGTAEWSSMVDPSGVSGQSAPAGLLVILEAQVLSPTAIEQRQLIEVGVSTMRCIIRTKSTLHLQSSE